MSYLLIALKYLPLVLEAVKAIESVIGAGKGKEKKAVVMGAVQAAAQAGEKADDKTVAVVSGLVDATVSALNAAGVFKTSEAAQ